MHPILFLVLIGVAIFLTIVFLCFDLSWFSKYRKKWFAWSKHAVKPSTIISFVRAKPRLKKVLRVSFWALILVAVVAGGWWWYSTHPSSPVANTALKTPDPSFVGPVADPPPEQNAVTTKEMFINISKWVLLTVAVIIVLLLLDIWHKNQKSFDQKKLAEWWSWTLEKIQSLLEISALSITWIVVVILFWRLEVRSPKAWGFLWTENHTLTIATAIILLIFSALRFFARSKEDKKDGSKKAGVAQFSSNALILVLIGLWTFYSIQYFQKSEKGSSLFAGDRVSPVARDEKSTPRLIDRFTITSDAWKTFDLPTGRSRVKVLGPTEAQTFYQNEYRETLRFEGDNYVKGNGPTDQLRLRALRPGEVVSVEIYQIQ